MFIYSVKGQNIKVFASIFLSALAIVLVAAFLPAEKKSISNSDDSVQVVKKVEAADFKNISNNEERVQFLKKYGWEVDLEAKEVTDVTIPINFDPIYEKYNQLQISEGLNLEKYKGKTVKKYTYLVNNYDYEGVVLANLLIYKNKVIGGDISSASANGFVHGFTKGNDFLT